jgi:hypothetical protein
LEYVVSLGERKSADGNQHEGKNVVENIHVYAADIHHKLKRKQQNTCAD